ncbi:hypothetical protein [Caulobacter sp. CCUG 60055]|nr:hypothetical protein [Caulobacter sp. CCUG 60055]
MTRPDDPATLVRRFAWLAAASFLAGFGGYMLAAGRIRWPMN